MIYVIDDDEVMAGCIARACGDANKVKVFSNAIRAMEKMSEARLPKLIFLDILLDGPDGFTFLNELASYEDTEKVPIVIVSSLDFTGKDLSVYGVVGVLKKETMVPDDIRWYVEKYGK